MNEDRRPLWIRVNNADRVRTFPIPANWTLEEAADLTAETWEEEGQRADVRLMRGGKDLGVGFCVCHFPPGG